MDEAVVSTLVEKEHRVEAVLYSCISGQHMLVNKVASLIGDLAKVCSCVSLVGEYLIIEGEIY